MCPKPPPLCSSWLPLELRFSNLPIRGHQRCFSVASFPLGICSSIGGQSSPAGGGRRPRHQRTHRRAGGGALYRLVQAVVGSSAPDFFSSSSFRPLRGIVVV